MSKKIYSEYDNRGVLYVDCSECTRGGNGDDKDKCSAGWKVKRGGKGGCYIGTFKKVDDLIRDELKKLLHQCTEDQQHVFRRLYSGNDLTIEIDKVVDKMPEDRISWALEQADRTEKNNQLKANR